MRSDRFEKGLGQAMEQRGMVASGGVEGLGRELQADGDLSLGGASALRSSSGGLLHGGPPEWKPGVTATLR